MGQQSQSGQSEFGCGKQLSAGEERSPLCVSAGVFLERTRSFPTSNATSATRSHVSVPCRVQSGHTNNAALCKVVLDGSRCRPTYGVRILT